MDQGDLADRSTMELWDSAPNVLHGKHFYARWNAFALSKKELRQE